VGLDSQCNVNIVNVSTVSGNF